MDYIKEVIVKLIDILNIPMNRFVKIFVGLNTMNDRKLISINLDTKSFNINSTLLYTMSFEVISIILCCLIFPLYEWFIQFTVYKFDIQIIKVLIIILFITLLLLIVSKQHTMFGKRTGEIVKGKKEVNLHYKGYSCLFVNTLVICISCLVVLSLYMYDVYEVFSLKLHYILIIILLSIDFINFIVCAVANRKRLIARVSKSESLIIFFVDGSKYEHHLYKDSFKDINIRIRYDNDIAVNEFETGKISLFEKTKINRILIGENILIFINNKWDLL